MKTALPDISSIESKVEKQIAQCKSEIESSFDSVIRNLDARIVQIRKETNMTTFEILINKKADQEPVNVAINEQQSKIRYLDSNLMSVVSDIRQF